MASREAWDALAKRLYAKGVDIFDAADPPLTDVGARDPKIVALTLLARTLRAMKAAHQLLQDDFIVEARTLTRTILENLFFSAALSKKGGALSPSSNSTTSLSGESGPKGCWSSLKSKASPPNNTRA